MAEFCRLRAAAVSGAAVERGSDAVGGGGGGGGGENDDDEGGGRRSGKADFRATPNPDDGGEGESTSTGDDVLTLPRLESVLRSDPGTLPERTIRDMQTAMRELAAAAPPPPPPPSSRRRRSLSRREGRSRKWSGAATNKAKREDEEGSESSPSQLLLEGAAASGTTLRDRAVLAERILDRLVREREAVTAAAAENAASEGAVEAATVVDHLGSIANVVTYNLSIRAWSNCGGTTRASGQNAEAVLRRLMQRALSSSSSTSLRPDAFSFAHAYAAWYRVARSEDQAGNGRASSRALERCDAVLVMMRDSLLDDGGGEQEGERKTLKAMESLTADFNRMLREWCQSGEDGNLVGMAERFLLSLDGMRKDTGGRIGPDVQSFNTVINAWAKSKDRRRCDRVDDLLERMERVSSSDDEGGGVRPDTVSYTSAIVTWANSGRPRSANRAQEILERCIAGSGSGECAAGPDTVTFNAVLNAWSKAAKRKSGGGGRGSGERGAAWKVRELLDRMRTMEGVRPDVRSYNLVIGTIAAERGAAEAEDFLDSMLAAVAKGKGKMKTTAKAKAMAKANVVRPNSVSFNTVIDAYALRGNVLGASRVLEKMEVEAFGSGTEWEDEMNGGNAAARPTARTYTAVLNALSKSGRPDAGKRAEAILDRIVGLYESIPGGRDRLMYKPDTRMYNAIILCFANSSGGGRDAALKGEELLSKLERMYNETGDEDIRPDVFTYSSVIKSWSESKSREGGQRAEAVLRRMEEAGIEPSAHGFNAAISAWSRSGAMGAAAKAESIMRQMEELWRDGNKSMKPNVFTYTSVIDGWARSTEPGSAQRAEILLKLMEVIHQKGDKSAKPNVRTYTACINAWAKSGDKQAGQKAEKLLRRMEALAERGDTEVKPNTYTYTAVINAFARSWERGAAQKAEDILKRMEAMSSDGDFTVKPNVRTYNTVINAWANSNELRAPQKAEAILQRMEKMFAAGDKDAKPSVVSFSSAINAWVGSTEGEKAQKAQKLLQHMKELFGSGNIDVKPNVVVYTSVINACAESRGNDTEKRKAFGIALETFKELVGSDSLSPNHVTYATMLKACSRLMPDGDERRKLVEMFFVKCCKEGLIDENVLMQLRLAAPEDLFLSLMGGIRSIDIDDVSVLSLPSDWTRSVRSKAVSPKGKN